MMRGTLAMISGLIAVVAPTMGRAAEALSFAAADKRRTFMTVRIRLPSAWPA